MSAHMFQRTAVPSSTKIPVPSSPKPLRRQTSLRIKGEKSYSQTPNSVSGDMNRGRVSNSAGRFSEKNSQFSEGGQLKRGSSFVELRERKSVVINGSRHAANVGEGVKIEPRSGQRALRGATTPESPARVRSLVSKKLYNESATSGK